ncbi:MAG: hypothetical protein ABI461_24170 [Polyangiaceae bacterium]
MNMRRSAFILCGFAIAGAIGCQAILGIDTTTLDENGSGDASTDGAPLGDAAPDDANVTSDSPAASSVAIKFAPASVFVTQGGSVDVIVDVTRQNFSGPVTLALASVGDAGITADGGADGGGADGIGATTLTIAAGSNTGILHLFTSATASVGPTALDFTLTSNATTSVTLPALIGGPPGSHDTTFGINGVAAVVNGFSPVAVAVGDDDSIWVINSAWKVLHYFADGTSDDTLNAKLATNLGAPTGSSTRIAVHGAVVLVCGNDGTSPTLRKLTTGGAYDPTFASSGVFQAKQSSNVAEGNFTGVAFSPTGDFLLSGTITGPTSNAGGVIVRVASGVQNTFVIGAPFAPTGIGADPSGRIGTGGTQTTTDGGSNLFGQTVDSALHDAGLFALGSPADEYTAQGAVVTPAFAIAVAGTRNHFLPSGSVAAFSTVDAGSAYFTERSHVGTWDNGFYAIATQPDGKVYVTGETGASNDQNSYISRIAASGSFDTWSASAGSGIGGPHIVFAGLAVDSVGRVIAAGNNETALYLMRVWP